MTETERVESFSVEIDMDDPAAIFAEPKGSVEISAETLGTLPDGGASIAGVIRAYIAVHPKLDAVTLLHMSSLGDGLVIRWRWRP